MIKVKVELWSFLIKEFSGNSDPFIIMENEIDYNTTVRNFFKSLSERYPLIGERIFLKEKCIFSPDVVITFNDMVVNHNEVYEKILRDGDKITVLPMFGGG